MATFETYEYTLPTWAESAIFNDDETGIDGNDLNALNNFLESLPKGLGHWGYAEDRETEGYFSHSNDIDPYGGNVVDVVYLVDVESTFDTDLDIDEIMEGYFTAALWFTVDEDGDLLDDSYTSDDICNESKQDQRLWVVNWLKDVIESGLLIDLEESQHIYGSAEYSLESKIGHDLWLTRCGHGVGFWDRGLGVLGEKLTESCENQPVYVEEEYCEIDGVSLHFY